MNRISVHLVDLFKDRELSGFVERSCKTCWTQSEAAGLSFSVVDHLGWDIKQIFDMAIAEGHIRLNPALLLFTPREAQNPLVRRAMTIKEVQNVLWRSQSVGAPERKACHTRRHAPRRDFALKWGRLAAACGYPAAVLSTQSRYS